MLNRRPRTEAQKAASRANGLKSTGGSRTRNSAAPLAFDTAASKRLANMVLLEGESPAIFLKLAREVHDELAPQSHIEEMLAAKLLLAYWRQLRAWSLERCSINRAASGAMANSEAATCSAAEFGARGIEALGVTGRFAISEYEARFDRQFARSLAAFTRYRKAQATQETRFDTPTLGSDGKQSNSTHPDPEESPENPGA